MAATEAQIAQLRRMVAEPTATTYDDEALAGYIEAYPKLDARGNAPDQAEWTATYDLNAAAADVWDEKAGAMEGLFDYSADGASVSISQKRDFAVARARYYRARRSAKTITARPEPRRGVPEGDQC